ncbi:MAG: HAD-IA family hydrolase [Gemmatimonadota bacterium]|nr:HAD-IA family hydrolase [Gemmatimonadota bacterium]
MTSISTVLFDLDGTLIDSIRLIIDSYHHTLATHGIAPRSDTEWLAGIGTPLWVQFAEWAHDPESMEAMVATYREYNLAHHDSRVTAYPGVIGMIQALQARGTRMGLVTSKNNSGARRGLKLIGMEDAMEVVIGADDVANPKPHPEPIHLAMERLGVRAEATIYVGDSLHDMHSGRAAGVRIGAVLWGPFDREHLTSSEPDHWLERPEDLVELAGG